MVEEPGNGIKEYSSFRSSEASARTLIAPEVDISSQGSVPSTDTSISSQGSVPSTDTSISSQGSVPSTDTSISSQGSVPSTDTSIAVSCTTYAQAWGPKPATSYWNLVFRTETDGI